ncbi:RNA polymerase sigma factor [Limnoglobus roseus]|uniref:RNA polymerase sigma factor n=1 Tax=Limnoglobus roseus TaxID=2598579 RepID=A0A5C1AT99_9BACT|nr:RNA polymerase sigma factor [Limnoglobus roseus]QEL20822.1 RNA polymerase sigma factor [Limnoglobus roseus]
MPRNRLPLPFLTAGHAAEGLPDADLVARFLMDRSPAAFEALVWRHGPMVRAVCRSVLRNTADADDAFQATFLVLAHKAVSIRRPSAVGGWLYGVAVRVARKAKKSAGRFPVTQDLTERASCSVPEPHDDVWPVIDEEIQRLPERYRAAVHLCYVAGLTTAEAAARLGIPKGTVLSRLAWGRGRLQARLTRRGITAGVAVLTTTATGATARLLDPQLVRATVQAATGGMVPAAAPAASLTAISLSQGVISEMALHKFRAAVLALAVSVSAAGVGVGGWAMAGGDDGKPVVEKKGETTPPPNDSLPKVTPPASDPPKEASPKVEEPASKSVTMQDLLTRLERQEKLNQDLRKELDRLNTPPAVPTPMASVLPVPVTPPPPPLDLPTASPPPLSVGGDPPAIPTAAAVPVPANPAVERGPGPAAKNGTMTIAKPGGTWYRVSGDAVCCLTFTEDRLTITNDLYVQGVEKGVPASRPATVTIEADYAISKDGVVFGYITGVDAPEGVGGSWQALEEQPFAFRFRADEKALTVKDVKLRRSGGAGPAMPPPAGEIEKLLIAGRYTDKKPAVPLAIPRADPLVESPRPDIIPSSKPARK